MTGLLKRKTPTQQFIEDAIAGGWKGHERHGNWDNIAELVAMNDDMVALVVLDPLAWQAVGKTRGWSTWEFEWTVFFDEVRDGKAIDEALAAISDGV